MRNPTDISYAYHIDIASSRGPHLKKSTALIKEIIKNIYNKLINHAGKKKKQKKKRLGSNPGPFTLKIAEYMSV